MPFILFSLKTRITPSKISTPNTSSKSSDHDPRFFHPSPQAHHHHETFWLWNHTISLQHVSHQKYPRPFPHILLNTDATDSLYHQDYETEFSSLDKADIWLHENPILEDPATYANNIIKNKLFFLIERKYLLHNNILLINEYLIAFIDHFKCQLGLKNKYSYLHLNLYHYNQ